MEMVSPPPPEQSPPQQQPPTPKQLKLSPQSDSSGELKGEGKKDSELKPSERTKKYLKEQKEKFEKQKASEVEKPKVKKSGLKKLRKLQAFSATPRSDKATVEDKTEQHDRPEVKDENKTKQQEGVDAKDEDKGNKEVAKSSSTKQDDEQTRNAHKMYMRYWRSVNECNLHCIRICTTSS